ncbi:hypothetical protein SARC_16194, partial [Sphaeroforma arctica JP610]
DAETRGQDYDRTKYLHMSVKEVEAHQEKREKKEQLMNKGNAVLCGFDGILHCHSDLDTS